MRNGRDDESATAATGLGDMTHLTKLQTRQWSVLSTTLRKLDRPSTHGHQIGSRQKERVVAVVKDRAIDSKLRTAEALCMSIERVVAYPEKV